MDEIAIIVVGGLILAAIISGIAWLRKRFAKAKPEIADQPITPESKLLSPTAPQHVSLEEALSLLNPRGAPWELTLTYGHRYRLANRMSSTATMVRVEIDMAVTRPARLEWAEVPLATSVTFVCQPAWGSTRVLEVSWDSLDFADGRGSWMADL